MKKVVKKACFVCLCAVALIGLYGCGKTQSPAMTGKKTVDHARDVVDDVNQQNQQIDQGNSALNEE